MRCTHSAFVVAGSAQSRVEKKTEKLTVCEKKHCCRIFMQKCLADSRKASVFGVRVDPTVEKSPLVFSSNTSRSIESLENSKPLLRLESVSYDCPIYLQSTIFPAIQNFTSRPLVWTVVGHWENHSPMLWKNDCALLSAVIDWLVVEETGWKIRLHLRGTHLGVQLPTKIIPHLISSDKWTNF